MNMSRIQILFAFLLFAGLFMSPAHGEQTSPPARTTEPGTGIGATTPEPTPQVMPVPETGGPSDPPAAASNSSDTPPVLIQQAMPAQEMSWPAAFVPEPQFEFAPVVDGDTVVHDFTIENQGTVPLTITDIRTGCACAVADYPKFILPNDKDKITVTIDTTGYGGRDFSRDIMIATNEPMNSMLKVRISGRINDFADFDPKKVIILRGSAGAEIKYTVTITPTEIHPFNILNYEADETIKDLVNFSIEKKDNKYILTAQNKMNTPGRYMGKLHIITDSTFKPQINMVIRGIIE